MSYDIEIIRHSLAHVLAAAVKKLWPDVKFGGGPAIENGFYYDFDMAHRITEEDFPKIEKEMKDLIRGAGKFEMRELSAKDAAAEFKGEPFKLEWIGELSATGGQLSVYQFRDFIDLCRGPHVESSKELPRDSFKIRTVAGAYWKGDSKNKMLQRVYVDAFATKEELGAHLLMMEEAAKRDHRKLGPVLGLFFFDGRSPGVPYWMPDGLIVYKELYKFWAEYHEEQDYLEFRSPLMNKKELYETSGHWQHYSEDMFTFTEDENNVYALSPMACPNAMVAYMHEPKSHRDLPWRLCDVDMLYRYEASGALNGLFRSYEFNQDDAHIFISEDMIKTEYHRIFDMLDKYYELFDMKYSIELATRPDDFMGEAETWNKAEAILKEILIERFGAGKFGIKEGEGAFYGPKLDIQMTDSVGRQWQMGTVQLDMQMPGRFGCVYTDKDGQKKTPIVIHRVLYGSLGRFLALALEHFSGKLPVWLSPTHAIVIPISDQYEEYAKKVAAELQGVDIKTATRGLRIKTDLSSESMQKKIRNAQLKQIPYMIIVGEKEAADGTVSIRTRDGVQTNVVRLSAFVKDLTDKIKTRGLEV
ncbi:MAG: threonine--tRNA ligase [Alphaproteobacteria bacterium]|nr:threonine--tRNA ligase [Alphaproteobacteria bacterium]MCL2758204.1 threonine--tRNA ligase [Alphaproteobacteria bacterium]